MLRPKAILLGGLFCLLFLAPQQTISAQSAQSKGSVSAGDNQTLQALLDEVHQLRMALEHANRTANEAQILVERIRIQQPRVDGLAHELGEIRSQIAKNQSQQGQFAKEIKEYETRLTSEQSFAGRADYEQQYKALQQALDVAKQSEQLLKDREAQLTSQVQLEQAKLDELNQRLDEVQHEIQIKQPTDGAQRQKQRP